MKITFEMLPDTGEFNVRNNNGKVIGKLLRDDKYWRFNPKSDAYTRICHFLLEKELSSSKDELKNRLKGLEQFYRDIC